MAMSSIYRMYRATPHARGSTIVCPFSPQDTPGYPACAGIDPLVAADGVAIPRLPRMRGDRPVEPNPNQNASEATPHARGSTRLKGGTSGSLSGYPACAGIDRVLGLDRAMRKWLPRMRGDRPAR